MQRVLLTTLLALVFVVKIFAAPYAFQHSKAMPYGMANQHVSFASKVHSNENSIKDSEDMAKGCSLIHCGVNAECNHCTGSFGVLFTSAIHFQESATKNFPIPHNTPLPPIISQRLLRPPRIS